MATIKFTTNQVQVNSLPPLSITGGVSLDPSDDDTYFRLTYNGGVKTYYMASHDFTVDGVPYAGESASALCELIEPKFSVGGGGGGSLPDGFLDEDDKINETYLPSSVFSIDFFEENEDNEIVIKDDSITEAKLHPDVVSQLGGGNSYRFPMFAHHAAFNLVDGTTYYFGANVGQAISGSTANVRLAVIPFALKIVGFVITTTCNNNSTTQEDSAVYLRTVVAATPTDTLLSNVVRFNASAGKSNYYKSLALNIDLAVDTEWEIKVVCPTWATNPSLGQYRVDFIYIPL